MADQKQDPLFQFAYFSCQLINERFSNQEYKLKELRLILEKGISGEIDMDTLIYKLSILLEEKNEDLLQKLKFFIPVEKTKIGEAVKSCCDLLNLARIVFKDNKKKYKSFIDDIIDFGKHKDVNRLKRKTSPILREHRALNLAFSEFIESDKQGNRSNNDAKLANARKKLFDCEDKMHESDIFKHRLLSVVESATKLIEDNLDQNEGEAISVGEYFSVLNFAFVKKNLKQKYGFLSSKAQRLEAMIESEEMITLLLRKYEKFEKAQVLKKARWSKIIQENTVITKRQRIC